MTLSLPAMLILSLIIGAVIGLERESYEDELSEEGDVRVGGLGVRTFSLITLLGTVSGLLREQYFELFMLVNITFVALLVCYYILGSIFNRDNGMTTEMAVFFAFLSGLFVSLQIFSVQIILALTVILILIMSYKEKVRSFVAGIHRTELSGFISYALISLVILPFLPNVSYRFSDIPGLITILDSYGIKLGAFGDVSVFNPFSLWTVVALITGVDLLGYLLEKTIGEKGGWLLASLAGGFISSTATTQSLAQQSKKSDSVNLLVSSAVFANMASFIQLFLLIAFVNGSLLVRSTGMILSMLLSSTIAAIFFLKIGDSKPSQNAKKVSESHKLFSLEPALKFAAIFLLIKLFSKIALLAFGSSGFLITTSIAALAGLDAVTINIAELTGTAIQFNTAILAIIIANAVNLIGKSVYSFMQGKPEFATKFAFGMFVIIMSSFVGLII